MELLKVIRSDENLKGLSVLLITAEAKKENIIEAIKAEANNCIIKPFSELILKRKLEDIFK
jgi:two-component system chemotaxis response regulator CheY